MSENNESARLYERGRWIVYTIAALSVLWHFVSDGTIPIIQTVLSILLCLRIRWVRVLFVIMLFISAFLAFWAASAVGVAALIFAAYSIASATILFISESVNVFFNKDREL